MKAIAVSVTFMPLLLVSACSCGNGHTAAGGAGTGGSTVTDSGPEAAPVDAADATGGSAPWDPVWHETEPKDWPKAPKASPEGCGEGCRVGLDVIPAEPGHLHFQDSMTALTAMNGELGEVFYSSLESDETWILGKRQTGNEGYAAPYAYGDFVSALFVRDQNVGGEVRLINAATGETKVAYDYARKEGEPSVDFTLINDKYVFWSHVGKGIMSRNLETGKVRTLVNLACEDLCATPTGLVCFNSPNYFIDQDTGETTSIDDGGALEIDGTCAHERDEIIWIDYRDPPGPGSSYWGYRNGGEVYVKHLTSGELTRLTHDSPDSPRGKTYPAVGKELAVWKEVAIGKDPNPDSGQFLYAAADDLIVLDRKTGERCRIHSDLVKYFTHMVVVDRWVYGSMGYVVGIDVDHPAIGCVKD